MRLGLLSKLAACIELLLQPPNPCLAPTFSCLAGLYNYIIGSMQRLDVFAVHGLMKNTNSAATLLLIGYKEAVFELARAVCSQMTRVQKIGNVLSTKVSHIYSPNVDLTGTCIPARSVKKLRKSSHFILPMVTFILDLNGSIDTIMKRMSRRRRRDIKKLLAYDYSYSVSRKNAEDFSLFYSKMYVPYVSSRFQEACLVLNHTKAWSLCNSNGGILFVKEGQRPISGILFQVRRRTLYAIAMGVINGSDGLMQDFAGQAALFFLIEWAREQGLKELNYGLALPFLNDGIFRYKKEWGMRIKSGSSPYYYTLRFHRPTEKSLNFLQHNPFLFTDKGKMKALILLNRKVTEKELPQLASECNVQGLESLLIVSYQRSIQTGLAEIPEQVKSQRKDLSPSMTELCTSLEEQDFSVAIFELDQTSGKRTSQSEYRSAFVECLSDSNSNAEMQKARSE